MTIKFCGMTVEDVRTTLGWNEQQSQMGISLILDSGDFNLIPPEGYPVWFSYGELEFNGILQRAEEDITTGGRRFKVQVVDPREILRCCSLVIGGYRGSTFTLPNLVNCFAYQEDRRGFGAANVTSAGMAWYLIRESINQIVNVDSETSFGGPLNYKGTKYSVDLSEVPTMPAFYRINATSISLFDAISQVCKDSNNDFFVTLHGYRIKINTVPKGRVIPVGVLQDYVRNTVLYSQDSTGGSFGREDVCGENTSVMLVGAEKEDLYETTNVVSFWGYDVNNQPIFGDKDWYLWVPTTGKNAEAGYDFYNGTQKIIANPPPKNFILKYAPTDVRSEPLEFTVYESTNFNYTKMPLLDIEMANLNSTVVFDVVRSYTYQCSTLEMRYALTGLGDWEDFIQKLRPSIYEMIYGIRPIFQDRKNNLPNNADVVVDEPLKIKRELAAVQSDVNDQRLQKLYNFVRHYAEEYYGRKYACSLPLIASAMNLETLQIVNAADIVQSAYKPEGSNPLGISALNETIFTDNNNKFGGFCRMYAPGTLLDGQSPNGSIIQGDDFYQKVFVEEQILNTRTTMAAVFTLSSPLQELPEGVFGRMEVVAAIKALCMKAFTNGFPMFADFEGISPARRFPVKVAIPLRSNVERYGPYWVNGSPGKTEFIEDQSLAPWNFGGFDAMSVYAESIIDMSRGINQYMESGQFTLAGPPLMNMGALLDSTGPSLTDLSTGLSASGITTTYTFKAYSPRNGTMSRQFAERLRSVSLTSQRVRKELKESIKESIALKQIVGDAKKAIKFEDLIKKELRRNTPHDVIVCNLYNKNIENDDFTTKRHVYSQISNLKEALTMISVRDDDRYRFNTVMSLNGIFVPFSMDANYGNVAIPKVPIIAQFSTNIVTWESYNHFANKSIDVIGYGQTYQGVKQKDGTLVKDFKPVAMRGPIWVNGYGPNLLNLNGHKTDATEDNSKGWMVGPVDLIFDNYRGVWTPHTLLIGRVVTKISQSNASFKTSGAISDMGVGNVGLMADSPTNLNIVKNSMGISVNIGCKNPFGKEIDVGVVVTLQYSPHYNCFVVTGADCV